MNSSASALIDEIRTAFEGGRVVPYLGPATLAADAAVPASPEALAEFITAKVSVPHKIRKRLTAAAQFVENFKHRKTLVDLVNSAFKPGALPTPLQSWLAARRDVPMIVDTWYDNAVQTALAGRSDWGQVQGLSQAEHFGTWFSWYDPAGQAVDGEAARQWATLLYCPIGGVQPAANYLISDSDYVEVLTEIDIQTPIPPEVQARRKGRSFLFLGCRFTEQLQRSFARQIMKRSTDRHWAILPGPLSRNEARFLLEQGIERIDLSLEAFLAAMQVPLPAVEPATQAGGTMAAAAPSAHRGAGHSAVLLAPEQLAGSLSS